LVKTGPNKLQKPRDFTRLTQHFFFFKKEK
ncbi:hypothetical protein C5S53_03710, partial [Methanophagales archaeon]